MTELTPPEVNTQEQKLISYQVKLFHSAESGVYCKHNNTSHRFTVLALNKADLRTKIESNQNGFFKGDRCEKCGTLAKVSF